MPSPHPSIEILLSPPTSLLRPCRTTRGGNPDLTVNAPYAMLLTQCGRVRLGNMVDPKYTLGASVLKSIAQTNAAAGG